MTTLYLVRHGETVDNVRQIMQGQTQGELTEHGWEQAIHEINPEIDIHLLTLEEFLEFLLELCCNNDSDFDDQAANVAFQELEGEIRTELDTAQDLADLFANASEEQLLEWVGSYYVNYIMQIFDELYYTHLPNLKQKTCTLL